MINRLTRGDSAIVARCATADDTGVIKHAGRKGARLMARTAIKGGRNMVG